MQTINEAIHSIKSELNEDMIDDILNDTCEVTLSGGCLDENYIHTFIASYFRTYDMSVVHKIFYQLQIDLTMEKYFSRQRVENYKKNPGTYMNGRYVELHKHRSMHYPYYRYDKSSLLFHCDKNNIRFIVMNMNADGFSTLDIYEEVQSYIEIDSEIIEVKYLEKDLLKTIMFQKLNSKS